MKKQLSEWTILFLSVVKWVFLATIIGVLVGLSTAGFLKLLNISSDFSNGFSETFYLLPVALFMSSALVKYLAPNAEGHGTEKVIEAVHNESGKIKAIVVPVKVLATLITIAAGGSVGKEGPCAQIGGGLSSVFADIFRFDDSDRKKIVICGISAGFASVFGTPVAGAIFGVEVLFIGSIMYDVLLPSFIAGIISYQVSSALGITYFHHSLNYVPVFSESFFLKVILSAVFFGLCSIAIVEIIKFFSKLSSLLKIWKPLKGLIGGAALILLTLIFSRRYLGLGLGSIESTLSGSSVTWYDFLVKTIFTGITLEFGGSGGIVTPILYVGSSFGALLAQILKLDIATFAGIGLVSVLAGATNTPIAASIMAIELFGPQIAPYCAVACVISFLISGNRSVYPSQILSFKKSASLKVDVGKVIHEIEAQEQPQITNWKRKGITIFKRTRRKLKRNGNKT